MHIALTMLAIYVAITLLLYGLIKILRQPLTRVKLESDKSWGAYIGGEAIGYYPSERAAMAAISEFKARAKDKLR